MHPTPELLRAIEVHGWLLDPRHFQLTEIGSGCVSAAYLMRDGTVLKVCRTKDGTMDYLKWCRARLMHFGSDSDEMAGFPVVYEFGETYSGYWCVMQRYQCASHRLLNMGPGAPVAVIRRQWETFKEAAELVECEHDIHSGNVMQDDKGNFILTDPLSGASKPDRATAPQVSMYPDRAQKQKAADDALMTQLVDNVQQRAKFAAGIKIPSLLKHGTDVMRCWHEEMRKAEMRWRVGATKSMAGLEARAKQQAQPHHPSSRTRRVADWKIPHWQKLHRPANRAAKL